MADSLTIAQAQAIFKEVYNSEGLINLIPENNELVKKVKFLTGDKQGSTFHTPVILSNEHGISYMASADGKTKLADSISMSVADAQVNGYEMLGRSTLLYKTMSRAMAKGKSAFIGATEMVVKNAMQSMTNRLEDQILYGQGGLGVVSSTSAAQATTTATTLYLDITAATWAVGLWTGAENAQVVFYNGSGALISSAADSIFTVSTVDVANKQITVTGTATGCAALSTAYRATSTALVQPYWFMTGGGTTTAPATTLAHKTFAGIDRMCTIAGSIWGIDQTAYSLWRPNTVAVGGNLTFDAINKGLGGAVGKGCREDLTLLVSPYVYAYLWDEINDKRQYDASYKASEAVLGGDKIKLISLAGNMEILPHNKVKAGEAFAIPLSLCNRIGSSEITMQTPGTNSDEMLLHVPDYDAYEFRIFSDQAFICTKPGHVTKYTGITY